MQENIIRFIKYRRDGNCFVNCLIQALTNLRDKRILRNPKPELEVFDMQTLYSSKSEDEFRPALNYLINNGYKIKIIDPDPFRDNNWGSNFKYAQIELRNYSLEDVKNLSKDGWQVIISTEIDKRPHAVLVTKTHVYNPTVQQWQKPEKTSYSLITYHANKKAERFLIAIKK